MYRMILVDDDEMERNGIRSLHFWKEMGVEIVAEAWNGAQALSLCQELHPDLVLSDVRMPIMNGVTFAAQLRQEQPNTRIVMMSGYEDFEAVCLSMRSGAEAYLTKPLSLDELRTTMARITGALKQEQSQLLENQRMKDRLEAMLPVLTERLLRDLLLGVRTMDDEQTLQEAQYLCPFLVDEKLSVIAIQLHTQEMTLEQRTQSSMHAFVCLEQILVSQSELRLLPIGSGIFVLIVVIPPKLDDEMVFDWLQMQATHILQKMKETLECPLTIAISGTGCGIGQLRQLYPQAMGTLQKQVLYSPNRIYWFDQPDEISPLLPSVPDTAMRLRQALLAQDHGTMQTSIKAFLQSMLQAGVSLENMHILCVELIFRYAILAQEDGKDFLVLFEGRELPYREILSIQGSELLTYLLNLFTQAMDELYVRAGNHAQDLVEQIKKIVAQRYHEPLSTASIAGEVFLTASHLRRVFKNLTGQTIQDHILATRMSKSRELLLHSSMRVFEIANAVGYDNHSYFSIVFKKYFGQAPGEYRNDAG